MESFLAIVTEISIRKAIITVDGDGNSVYQSIFQKRVVTASVVKVGLGEVLNPQPLGIIRKMRATCPQQLPTNDSSPSVSIQRDLSTISELM